MSRMSVLHPNDHPVHPPTATLVKHGVGGKINCGWGTNLMAFFRSHSPVLFASVPLPKTISLLITKINCPLLRRRKSMNRQQPPTMPKLTPQEKLERKKRLEDKREARRLVKEEKEQETAASAAVVVHPNSFAPQNDDSMLVSSKGGTSTSSSSLIEEGCQLWTLSDESLNHILWFLPARDLGALTLTCRRLSKYLVDGRISYVWCRLHAKMTTYNSVTGSNGPRPIHVDMCDDLENAKLVLEQSYMGGDTGRIIAKGQARKEFLSDFVSYARFLQEAALGYSPQNYGGKTPALLPKFVNGRFVSVSPEHTLCRVGGGSNVGAGGSGVAAWVSTLPF
jgi:hypothetical protein